MSAIVDVKVVIAVELQQVKMQHEPLQNAVRLEGDSAVQVPLVAGPQHAAIELPVLTLQEVVLAERVHVICSKNTHYKKHTHEIV